MLKIKLQPIGKNRGVKYRVVVAEENSKVTGSVVEVIGTYTPQDKKFEINRDKLTAWQGKGAQITDGVRKLLTS